MEAVWQYSPDSDDILYCEGKTDFSSASANPFYCGARTILWNMRYIYCARRRRE